MANNRGLLFYMNEEKRVCSKCGDEKPLNPENFRWQTKDDQGCYMSQCRVCLNKAKAIARARKKEQRQMGLEKIEELGVDAFLKTAKATGSNIPHTAELVEHVMSYFGGVGGFSSVLVKQYWDADPGGSQRNKIIETMTRLVAQNVESGGAKKPLDLWSEEELETELEQRMQEAVSRFRGVTIDVVQEKITSQKKAPKGITEKITSKGSDNKVSKRRTEGSAARTPRKKD
jgi:hypothetical protein